MRFNKKVIFTYFLVIGLGLALISVSLETPISSQIKFSIISPNAEEGDIPIPGAVCFAKAQTSLGEKTSDGTFVFVRADSSPFLIDNPQFTANDLTDPETGKTIGQLGHFLKMRCEVGFNTGSSGSSAEANQLICEDPTKSEQCVKTQDLFIDVRPSSIEVHIFAEHEVSGQKIKERIALKNYQTEQVRLEDSKEETLLFAQINIEELLNKLPTGDYNVLIETKTSGVLNMFIENFSIDGTTPTLTQYYVGQNDIPTYFNLEVTGNVGGEDPDSDGTCTLPKIYDEVTRSCITPQTEDQDQTIKDAQNTNTQDESSSSNQGGSGGNNDAGDSGENEFVNVIGELFSDFFRDIILWDTEALNSQKYFGIYALIFIFIIAGIGSKIAQSKRQARPVYY